MTARLFQIPDADQSLPTIPPEYITRALLAYGSSSFSLNNFAVANGFGYGGTFSWGGHDELQGAWGGFGTQNSIISAIETGGSGSNSSTPGSRFYGQVNGNSSSLVGELQVVDFGCGEVVLDASSNESTLLGLLSLSGTTLETYVGALQLTTTGLQAVTGVGFQPDMVLFGGVEHIFWGPPGAAVQPGGLMFGAAAGNDEMATIVSLQYLASTGVRTCRTSGSRCILSLRPTLAQASMDSFDPDGFTLDVASFNSNLYWFIAIRDPGGSFAVGTGTQGDATFTPGFTPEAVVFGTAGNTALDATQGGAVFGMGAVDSILTQYAGLGGGSATARSVRYFTAKALALSQQKTGAGVPPTLDGEAVVTALGATSTLNWTLNGGQGVKFGWAALRTSEGQGFGGCGLLGQIYRWLKR